MGKKAKDRKSSSQNRNEDINYKNYKKEKFKESDNKIKINNTTKPIELDPLEEEDQINNLFGIKEFNTTKNKSHIDSDLSAVFKGSKVKRKYRPYMNRRGGFNRVLDKID